MNCTCPLCSVDLSNQKVKKVPAKGESSWLALRWYLECPSCKGALQVNQHPYEKSAFPILVGIAALLNAGALAFGFRASSVVAFATIAFVVLGAFVGHAIVVPKDWPKYAPHSEPKL